MDGVTENDTRITFKDGKAVTLSVERNVGQSLFADEMSDQFVHVHGSCFLTRAELVTLHGWLGRLLEVTGR